MELQTEVLANATEFQYAASTAADGYSVAEQSDGAVITDALPYAAHIPLT